MLLFPAFQAMDVFGTLDVLNMLSLQRQLNLAMIAETLDPVSTKPLSSAMNKFNSSFFETVLPTHTFKTAPDIDVLIVPGGLGTRAPDPQLEAAIAFIAESFPKIKYLYTFCTGASLAARAGVLDGHTVTTNKRSFAWATSFGPKVNWVAHARWVDDGKVFSGSGISAGVDGMYAFVAARYGQDVADGIALGNEWSKWPNATYDPFADHYNLPYP
jgi:transcriptional regulator GlxA family with amidase domain